MKMGVMVEEGTKKLWQESFTPKSNFSLSGLMILIWSGSGKADSMQ